MLGFRAIVIGILAIGTACASAVAATASVFEDLNPELASKMLLASGFADANVAQQLVGESANSGGLVVALPRARSTLVRKLSLESYEREPLNSVALAGLALAAQGNGDMDRARILMRDAVALSRRTLVANAWVMADSTRSRNLNAALGALDNALRSSEDARPLLIQSLVQNLTHSELIVPVARLLQDRPPWSDDFWHQAFRFPDALPNVAQLRLIAHQRGLEVSADDDRALLDELSRNGLFSEAEQVFTIVRPDDRANGEIIRNSSFTSVPRYGPFDWKLFFDETLTADLLPSSGQLSLRVYDEDSGRAARQLVALTPSEYVLAAKYAGGAEQATAALSATLTCAETAGGAALVSIPLRPGDAPHMFAVPDTGCRYYWLDLNVAADGQRETGVIQLNSISLKKVPTGG